MNDDTRAIKAALNRRFARANTPAFPDGAWRAAGTPPPAIARTRGRARGFAYAAALLGVVAVGGLAAQASSSGKLHDLPFISVFVSSKPLQPLIHRADRLTIAQAQRHVPFDIVEPAGLPAGSQFLYAHVISEHPVPHVVLNYQAHIANRYYRIAVGELTAAVDPTRPPMESMELRVPRGTKTLRSTTTLKLFCPSSEAGCTAKWHVLVRRWKHGDVYMEMPASELPAAVSNRIVRENTR